MSENNFINQLRNYRYNIKEDLDLDVVEPIGYKENDYVYILGDKQKQMLIDAIKEEPFDVIQYFFNHGDRTLASDLKLMDDCFGCIWKLYPERGYQNLRIIQDGEIYDSNYIKNKDVIDNIVKSINEVHEDLELDVVDTDTSTILAQAIAERIGGCIVDGNVIYQMMDDFETYADEDIMGDNPIEISYGIFCIFKVFPKGKVIVYNSKYPECEDVDNIGQKPLDYYVGSVIEICKSLEDFLHFLDSYYGRDWFGTYEEIQEFIDTYRELLGEDLDVDETSYTDLFDKILYEGETITLGMTEKEEIAAWFSMEDEDWDGYKNSKWEITKNSSDIDVWYNEADDDEFPFALLIDGTFYDALTSSCVEDVVNIYEREHRG